MLKQPFVRYTIPGQRNFSALLLKLFVVLCLLPLYGFSHSREENEAPRVILVQLRTEQNRQRELKNHHQSSLLEILKKDIAGLNEAVINDFKDHLAYCPVYYYVDTNYEKIKSKHFEGILLDASGEPVKDPVINSSSTNYLVAMWGHPVMQSVFESSAKDTSVYHGDYGLPMASRGLILHNDKLIQIAYYYKLDWDASYIRKHFAKKYQYKSKKFDFDYAPCAQVIQRQLTKDATRLHPVRIWQGRKVK